jgi:hypothetical protein
MPSLYLQDTLGTTLLNQSRPRLLLSALHSRTHADCGTLTEGPSAYVCHR